MPSFTHILFPVDFSERCEGAAPFVDCMARRNRAKVTLFAAANPYYPAVMEAPLVDPQDLLMELKETLDGAFPEFFKGVEVNRVAVLGDAAEEITEFARAHRVDLIMMPSHGYGPFRQLLLGSVTSKVLHDVGCPVWTTAHTGMEPDRQHLGLKKILCAVDGTPASAGVMRFAAGFAKESGADLRLVTVAPGIDAWPERQMDVEFEEQMRADAKQKLEDLEQAAKIDVPFCVEVGPVADRVAEEVERHGADLLVIGRGAIHEKLGRLRTHAQGLIRLSPCPVLSI
jgi:nucleotide-binding universal stress UspA family protein